MPLQLDDPSLPADLSPVLEILRAAHPREGCGVVLEGPAGFRIVGLRNAEADPEAAHRFRFADEEWLAVLREADRRGEALRCVFHSHLGTSASFSSQDAHAATAAGEPLLPEVSHLVVALEGLRVIEARIYRWNGAFFREVARVPAVE